MPSPSATCRASTVLPVPGSPLRSSGRSSAIELRKPVGQVDDDAGEEAGFRGTEQETCDTELPCGLNKTDQNRAGAPSKQDAGNPTACAPLFHNQRPRNLQQEISQEKYPSAETEHSIGKTKVRAHRSFCKGHVCTVQIGNHVEDKNQRENAESDFSANRAAIQRLSMSTSMDLECASRLSRSVALSSERIEQ